MAYFRDVSTKCPECGRPATCEVFNQRNASYGRYCRRHAEAMAKRLTEAEKTVNASEPPR